MNTSSFGPEITEDGVLFRLWAPLQNKVRLSLEPGGIHDMQPGDEGWHLFKAEAAGPGSRYKFVLSNGLAVPDPGSRFQPEDVHGPSEVIDPSFSWQSAGWRGRRWEETILYELHIGTFTEGGTFLSAIEKLDHLKNLGITAIQIMPVAEFPGRWNWGYDGVLPYAPDASYGRPEDLKRLVDAAHEREISVFLDVVYNHFGPDGNYMPLYAPLFTEKHASPWGAGVNYDDAGAAWVRELVIQNALYWITEFRMDGLRLDAVHAIKDDGREHLLHELAGRVQTAAAGRHVHLVVENEDNNSALLERDHQCRPTSFTAQWNDDIHHVLHVAGTGETFGYYRDYADDVSKIGRALAEGFVFQGEHMAYRGETRGTSSTGLPPTAFISFIQNHDQIGNRAQGDRVLASVPSEALKALAAVYLLSPQIPMLFMGEEWRAEQPFPYFCDFNAELNDIVRKGRRTELSRLPGFDAGTMLDPAAESTFHSAKLKWPTDQNDAWLTFYRFLINLRREHIVPLLTNAGSGAGVYEVAESSVSIAWRFEYSTLRLCANLSNRSCICRVPEGDIFFQLGENEAGMLSPWGVVWTLE
ncbi:malto-oligosyltrehalose trehalohydrolase [Pararhizobium gei]|uniref:malto-oligosyltrehalose trehalohydrolase n=1 Tax=Pararhizobium gei TaxID=1395951 RepID=UPI0023DA8C66|nr:malto-oligosyltrehalose trehalohydrolase [Rhizobium gei]